MASCSWCDAETKLLIALWSQKDVQTMLQGSTRKRFIFEQISRDMESAGYSKTAEQCKSKIKRLKFCYRRLKEKRESTDETASNWQFWEEMDTVLAGRCQSPLQSIATERVVCSDEEEDRHDLIREQPTCHETAQSSRNQCEESFDCVENVAASSFHTRHNSHTGSSLIIIPNQRKVTRCSSGQAQKEINSDGNSRKRKRDFDRREEQSEILVDKMMKMLEETNQHHMRLEEKLLQLTEQMRRDSQEFQMRMMSLLSNLTAGNGAQPSADVYRGAYCIVHPDDI